MMIASGRFCGCAFDDILLYFFLELSNMSQSSVSTSAQDSESDIDLHRLIQKILDDQLTLGEIDRQDVILFIGKPGAGKTSTICFITGEKMELKQLSEKRLDGTNVVVEGFLDTVFPVEGFRIGHTCDATTKVIRCRPIPGTEQIAADSCGFLDPEGTTVDLANAVTLRNAMRSCTSLRPVVVIDARVISVDKGGPFEELLDLILRFFSPIQDFLPSMSFLFTHGSAGVQAEQLKTILSRISRSKHLENKLDRLMIIKYIFDYITKHSDGCFLFSGDLVDLVSTGNSNASQRRNELIAMLQIPPALTHQVIQRLGCPISTQVQKSIEAKCSEIELLIIHHLGLFDYRSVYDHSNLLRHLESLVNLPFITTTWTKVFDLLTTHISTLFEEVDAALLKEDYESLGVTLLRCNESLRLRSLCDFSKEYQQRILHIDEHVKLLSKIVIDCISYAQDAKLISKTLRSLNLIKKELKFALFQDNQSQGFDFVISHMKKHFTAVNDRCGSLLSFLSAMMTSPADSGDAALEEDRQFMNLLANSKEQLGHLSAQDNLSFPISVLFYDLVELKSVVGYHHDIPQLSTFFEERNNQFLALFRSLSMTLLGKDGFLETIRDLTLTERSSRELSRIYSLLQVCFTSGANNCAPFDLFDLPEKFMEELINHSNAHLNSVDSSLLKCDYVSIQESLRVLMQLEFDDSSFAHFRSDLLIPKVKLVKDQIEMLCKQCEEMLKTIRLTSSTESSVISSIATLFARLRSSCCLEFLYPWDADPTPSEYYSRLASLLHEDWTSRVSYFNSTISTGDTFKILESFTRIGCMTDLSEFLSIEQNIGQISEAIEQSVVEVIRINGPDAMAQSEALILEALNRGDFYLSFLSQNCRVSILFSKYLVSPIDWCDQLEEKLQRWKEVLLNFIQSSVNDAREKSFKALRERDARSMNSHLDSLKRLGCLEKFLDRSSTTIYDSTRFALLAQIESLITDAKATVRRGSVNRVTKIRLFLEELSHSGVHFGGFDFRTHVTALANDHYEFIGKLPTEIENLLSSSQRFPSIRSKLLMAQETAADVFAECDAQLTEYFEVLEERLQRQALVNIDNSEMIQKLISDLTIIQRAQCLSDVISYDIQKMYLFVCSLVSQQFAKLQSGFKNFMKGYKFEAASRRFELIRIFASFDLVLSKKEGNSDEKYQERIDHLWESSVGNLEVKLLKDCEAVLGLPLSFGPSDTTAITALESFIRQVDLNKLYFLYQSVATAATITQTIFQEEVHFPDIQSSLNLLISQHIETILKRIPSLIKDYGNTLDLAERLINLCENICASCECSFEPKFTTPFTQKFKQHRNDLKAARELGGCGPMKFQAKYMDQNRLQLKTVHDEQGFEQYSKVYYSFVEIFREKSNEITSIMNLRDSIPTMDKKTLEICINYTESLIAFKEKIRMDQRTRDDCETMMDNLESFFIDLCLHWKGLQVGVVDPLISLVSESQPRILPIFRSQKNEFLKIFRDIQSKIFEVAAKLESCYLEVVDFDLFHSHDISGLTSNLGFLREQMIESQSFHEESKSQRYYPLALGSLRNSLRESIRRFEDYILRNDFQIAATGMSNLLNLSEFDDLGDICDQVKKEFRLMVETLTSQIVESVRVGILESDLKELDHLIQIASLIDQEFKYCLKERGQAITEIRVLFEDEFTSLVSGTRNSLEGHCDTIVSIKSLVSEISNQLIQSVAAEYIDRYLDQLKDLKVDLWSLSVRLTDAGPLGEEVVSKHAQFRRIQVRRFNQAAPPIDIDHALRELKQLNDLSDAQIGRLKDAHTSYVATYETFLSQYLIGYQPGVRAKSLDILVSEIQKIARGENPQNRLTDLLAGVFALWTIKTSEENFQESNETIDLKQPHVLQVLAIFRLLGLDEGTSFLSSLFQLFTGASSRSISGHLIQMKTGEGKSILLAGLSCVLALLGYQVCCACYSQYLTDRDAKLFDPLFETLEISSMIEYSTLGSLVENVIKGPQLRAEVRERLLSTTGSSSGTNRSQDVSDHQASHRVPRILLFDEADIFLSPNFLGATYNPVTTYHSPETEALFRYVWDNRQRTLLLSEIQELPEYRDLVTRVVPAAIPLVDHEINKMLKDVHRFQDHSYEVVVKEDGSWKIGYKLLDSVSFSTSFGYQTAFAYLHEMSKRPESRVSLKDALTLKISCGVFSYAEVPCPDGLSPFQCVMGVSGKDLSFIFV
jgi:hypothetical protein